jgi:hypothetical protein
MSEGVVVLVSDLMAWGEKERKECTAQFDLFVTTSGQEGWDPDSADADYIKEKAQTSNIVRPFLSRTLGGLTTNRDSDKAIGGYKRATSEYFVKLALGGTRRKDFLEKCKPSVANKRAASTPASTGKYNSDKEAKNKRKSNKQGGGDNEAEEAEAEEDMQSGASKTRAGKQRANNATSDVDNDLANEFTKKLAFQNYVQVVTDKTFPYAFLPGFIPFLASHI